jgi:phenylacetate-coenzyme A ligase PaaK-like adenylate-forming protein
MGAIINTIVNWYKILRINHSGKKNIADLQQQSLRRLLHHAVSNSEFYQNLYRGIDAESCKLQNLQKTQTSRNSNLGA